MSKVVRVLTTVILVACAESPGASVETGGTIVVLVTQDPGSLFPPLLAGVQAKQILEQIYDYLADVGPDLNTRNERGFRPQLAKSWSWSADSMQLSFQIDPRARWHDGHSVTAHDVAFTFALNRNPQLASRYASSL